MSKPVQVKEQWESEYESGLWNRLHGGEEFAHYAVLAALIQRGRKSLRLLDLGSGEGVILQYLDLEVVKEYVALDISQVALDGINPKREGDRTICSTLEAFNPDSELDVVLFNEILYYTSDPVAHVLRIAESLAPTGTLIISMYQKKNPLAWNNRCIRKIRKLFASGVLKLEDAISIKTILPKDATWQIFVAQKSRS